MKITAERYLKANISEDLASKMVFVGGPRQVGKTTLALSWLTPPTKSNPHYINWDTSKGRTQILSNQLPVEVPLLVLDEVHKYSDWRRVVKGLFDQYVPPLKVIVTGSARLDYYRKGGDSLQGRYHYFRLHPISLSEMGVGSSEDGARTLLQHSGFPEPLIKSSQTFLRRWRRERMARVLQEDLRDLENVQDLTRLEQLVQLLPERVGTPLSVNSLAKGLQAAHETVDRWLAMLENLYVVFRIMPYEASRIRAVKKEKKLYFWDWSQAPEGGARFENLVASHLLKYCHYIEDTEGHSMELRYLRDEEGREVDFVVLRDNAPLFAVECKLSEKSVGSACTYFRQRTKIPKFYQVHMDQNDYGHSAKNVRVLPFWIFNSEVGLI